MFARARACSGSLASQRWTSSLGQSGPVLKPVHRAIAPAGAALIDEIICTHKLFFICFNRKKEKKNKLNDTKKERNRDERYTLVALAPFWNLNLDYFFNLET